MNYRDTPPYRFTIKEFADPKFRVQGNNQAPKISDDPSNPSAQQYELKIISVCLRLISVVKVRLYR